MTTNYGRRKDDMPPTELSPEFLAGLTDSQKVHINLMQNYTSLNTVVNDLQHSVNMHDQILITGDAKDPSLMERMRNVEKYIDGLRYWGRIVGGALIIQTLAFFAGIVVAVVRFLPLLEKLASNP